MDWKQKLTDALERKTLLCIGLDTDLDRFREGMVKEELPQFEINRKIIDSTADLAAAYKLNQAFYEVQGADGILSLERTVSYIREKYPNILVILDAKKGDIGNTSKAYARAAFEILGVDSITINAYMGKDAVSPFSKYLEKLVFVLCRTSNALAGEIQDTPSPEMPLYLRMAELIRKWNDGGNLGAVVGATFPDELGRVRKLIGPDMVILVPGIGAQGGDLIRVLENGTDDRGWGVLINVSRGIIFAFEKDGGGIAEASRKAAMRYHGSIEREMKMLGRW